jgi:hypothetical protein
VETERVSIKSLSPALFVSKGTLAVFHTDKFWSSKDPVEHGYDDAELARLGLAGFWVKAGDRLLVEFSDHHVVLCFFGTAKTPTRVSDISAILLFPVSIARISRFFAAN